VYAELPAMVQAKRKGIASFFTCMVARKMMWNILEIIPA
jgi:hypothetical protein